ncbi:hypothetical protein P280DRAFT_292280 [Massarina eburnea CBS 473.64]|uniref:C2H2-type domain-containing protein n=1 Tax=Massarina eburnea CBS 473.64 TaxID=1395130 RepID=A0A6A6S3F4_9PLEO|nr:hypothetical protein P280DRAFT_292280 [Massarina eburnea CBS 473.64]
MQASTDAAASATTSKSARRSSLGHTLLHCITPQELDSASTGRPGDSLQFYSHSAADGNEVTKPLQQVEPSDNAFAGITSLFWDDDQRFHASPQAFWDFENFNELSLDTNSLEPIPEPSLPDNWITPWQLDTGATELSVFDDKLVFPQPQHVSFAPPTCTDYGSEQELPMWSPDLTGRTYSAEPVSPISLPSVASVYALDRRRRDSISSRGSGSTSQISSRSCISEAVKRRIDPLKHTRTPSREPSDSFSCSQCERTFRYKKDVERHKTSIHDKRPSWFCPAVKCRFATKGFSRKDKAVQHIKTHRSNSDASLEPVTAAGKASSRAIGSAPASPRDFPVASLNSNHDASVLEEDGNRCTDRDDQDYVDSYCN